MPFTGKATYSAGSTLPEIAEDVADIIGIVSPYETPLLEHLGDPQRAALSTVHEWLEDELLPNTDAIDDSSIADGETATTFTVAHGDRFRTGDQIQVEAAREVMLVTAVSGGSGNDLTVVRGYGGTTAEPIADGDPLHILGNAALEGADAPAARFTNRSRRTNYTQIFTAGVEVSGSQLAAQQIGLDDEMDYQKQERLRELMRDLENCVINGVAADATAQGGSSTRRTMEGVIPYIQSNAFENGVDGFPSGSGGSNDELTETQLNHALRQVWEQSNGMVDTIVVSGFQKRRINSFLSSSRQYDAADTRFRDMVGMYESDFGVCRVVLSRWVPSDTVLLLDSSRVDVLPMAGRSFYFKKLATQGDRELGQVIGEYTLEMRNENAHGLIRGLANA
jgi:hypothetical protein